MVANHPLFRPPAEADSLILQIDRGCPYNRCTFCGMYKEVKFQRRAMDEVMRLIESETRQAGMVRRVFLADGDVMSRPYDELRAILEKLGEALPLLARVNIYATGRAIAAKNDTELAALRTLKLHTLYMGLESGHEETLRQVKKGESAASMVNAAIRAQNCGLRMSVMVLLGLGGAERSGQHIEATATALNRMSPRLLSVLRVVPVPGTELAAAVEKGDFKEVSELAAMLELQQLVKGLELPNTIFRANHSSNVVPLEARLSRGKAELLAEIDYILKHANLDAVLPGPRPFWL